VIHLTDGRGEQLSAASDCVSRHRLDKAAPKDNKGQVLKKVLAIVLLVVVTPAVAEVAEAVAHLASHGDYVHSKDGQHRPMGQDEHGCTPSLHFCHCCAGSPATVRSMTDGVPEDLVLTRTSAPSAADRLGRLTDPPPLPPPIA
jgi:hypothetical protein